MAERQPIHIPEPQRAPHEGGNGSSGLPPTLHERAKPPPESTLSRAVERTRALYERNGWVFLPLVEAARPSPSLLRPQTEPVSLREEDSKGERKAESDHTRAHASRRPTTVFFTPSLDNLRFHRI
jgi:hypothetical protein